MATRDDPDEGGEEVNVDSRGWTGVLCPMEKVCAGIVLVVAIVAIIAAAWDFSGL